MGSHAHHYILCGRRQLECTSARACASGRQHDCLWSYPSGFWPSSSLSLDLSTPPLDHFLLASLFISSLPLLTSSPSDQLQLERYIISLFTLQWSTSKISAFKKVSFYIIAIYCMYIFMYTPSTIRRAQLHLNFKLGWWKLLTTSLQVPLMTD